MRVPATLLLTRGRAVAALGGALGIGLLIAAGLLGSCSTFVPPPEVDEATAPPPEVAWDTVLREAVDEQGRIDFERLKRDPAALDAYVAWLARNGPRSAPGAFATEEERLAHHINAYNALSMYNVLDAGVPARLEGIGDKADMFYFRELQIDGERRSLHRYETDEIRAVGDPRVHFALNCMTASCPRLPREAFRGADLDAQLDREARRFLNDEANVRVDHDRRVVHLSEIFELFEDDFLAVAPSLLAYVNRYRDEPVPEDYAVEIIPYDWTIKAKPPSVEVAPPGEPGGDDAPR